MLEHWERLAEAQRIRQEIEAEFEHTLAQAGREAAERVRRITRSYTSRERVLSDRWAR